MKRGLVMVAIAIAAGCAAYWVGRARKAPGHHADAIMLDAMPELEWLRRDLKLSEDQLAKVQDLHAAYKPQCASMCARIAAARGKMDRIAKAAWEVTPELEAAVQEHANLLAECQDAMLKHLYATAAVLDERQVARYLEMTLPFALDMPSSAHGDHHVH